MNDSRLVVIAYDDRGTGEAALAALAELAGRKGAAVEDAVVVERDEDGDRLELRTAPELDGDGTIGFLLGLLLGAPVAGTLVGMAGGAGASLLDTGIPDEQMRSLGRRLHPGAAALFAIVGAADFGRVRCVLAPYGGDVVTREVAVDVLAALSASR